MKRYDVIIIGAGIGGVGLTYNLKRFGFKGSVLLIDQDKIGGNVGHSCRNTFSETVKEYNLPVKKYFKGCKIGMYDKVFFKMDKGFYAVNYNEVCNYLFKNSNVIYKKEKAITIKNNILVTNLNKYKYKFLIDCSGCNFFTRKILKMSLPFRYWLGNVRTFKNDQKINEDYFLYLFSNGNYCEEIYYLDEEVIQGDWQYTDKIDFSLIKPSENSFFNLYHKNSKLLSEKKVIIPCSYVFPIVYNNIALLGDSFGNPTPSSAEGIRPILDSSKLLSHAIIKNDLKYYENSWKKRYHEVYYTHLVSRMDINSSSKLINSIFKYPTKYQFFSLMKKYPEIALKRLRNEKYIMPKEILNKFPIISLLIRQILYRTYVKLKLKNIIEQ